MYTPIIYLSISVSIINLSPPHLKSPYFTMPICNTSPENIHIYISQTKSNISLPFSCPPPLSPFFELSLSKSSAHHLSTSNLDLPLLSVSLRHGIHIRFSSSSSLSALKLSIKLLLLLLPLSFSSTCFDDNGIKPVAFLFGG